MHSKTKFKHAGATQIFALQLVGLKQEKSGQTFVLHTYKLQAVNPATFEK